MKNTARLDRNCSVARALEIVGDPWSVLTLRSLCFGKRRFNEIRDHGAIAKKILAKRLKSLVDQEILERRQYQSHPDRFEYHLTEKGLDLYLPAIAIMHWGDVWVSNEDCPPVTLRHTACGKEFHAVVVCSECDEELRIHDVTYRDGPGAGFQHRSHTRRRRSPSPEIYQRGRPCSVARSFGLIADRWAFLIMREICFGVSRFDEFHRKTGIARNILADRLASLVANGLLQRRRYSDSPPRYEYKFSDMGRAIYGPILSLLAWGDRWMAGESGPPLLLTHKTCGKDFHPLTVCSECRGKSTARDVTYTENAESAELDDHPSALPELRRATLR